MSTRSLLWWIALVAGAELAVRGHLADRADAFHGGAWLLAAALVVLAHRVRGAPVAAATVLGLALVPALLSLLALADWPPAPAPDPDAPAAFWAERAADRATLVAGDPDALETGSLRLFGHRIAVGARGFRARPDAGEGSGAQRPRFRVVAFGDSTTFGATRSPRDLPWPARLERAIGASRDCAVPVEVVNAGALGRGYARIVRDFAADATALDADLALYYPGPRDLGAVSDPLRDIPDAEPVPPRASEALRRLEAWWRNGRARARYEAHRDAPLPDDLDLRDTRLARAYRAMILAARERGIEVVISSMALAVTPDSPEAEIDRYEAVEPGTRRLLLARRRHTLLARQVAASLRAHFVDAGRALDGAGPALFADLWHLTPAGRERLAEALADGLGDLLGATPVPGCRPRG